MERENVPYGVGSIFLYQPVKLLISAAQLDILTWQCMCGLTHFWHLHIGFIFQPLRLPLETEQKPAV